MLSSLSKNFHLRLFIAAENCFVARSKKKNCLTYPGTYPHPDADLLVVSSISIDIDVDARDKYSEICKSSLIMQIWMMGKLYVNVLRL